MPATEGDWSLEVTLRGTTFGTEVQARETAERWRKLVAVAAGNDVELVRVDTVAVARVEPELSAWVGTVAFEGVPTTDGRALSTLRWPRLAAGPLPVVLWGTGERVGTVTEVWRETVGPHGGPRLEPGTPLPDELPVPEGRSRIVARGTVHRHLVPESGRIPLGADVTSGRVHEGDDHLVVIVEGKLTAVTLYPDDSGQQAAWPDCALEVADSSTLSGVILEKMVEVDGLDLELDPRYRQTEE